MAGQTTEVLPKDPIERRRVQNRIAQRKFRDTRRQKRAKGATQALQATSKPVEETPTGLSVSTFNKSLSPDLAWIDSFLEDQPFVSSLPDIPDAIPATSQDTIHSSGPNPIFTFASAEVNREYVIDDNYLPPKCPHVAGPVPSLFTDDFQAGSDYARSGSSGTTPEDQSRPIPLIDESFTSLHIAAANGNDKMLRMLLQSSRFGVNVDDTDGEGKTALQLALRNRHQPCVELLLAHGARVDAADLVTGWNSMHWAVFHRNADLLRLLLEQGQHQVDFDIDAHDVNGWTATHCAIAIGYEAGLEILLENGANPNLKARRCMFSGGTPVEIERLVRTWIKQQTLKT